MVNNHKICLLCSSEKLNVLEKYKSAYLCKCKNCGFVFSKKIPTETELNNFYKGYGRDDYLSPVTIKRYNELLDKFEKFRKTGKIIDVGCGIGYFLEIAKKRGWEVYGTEFTDDALEICKSKGIKMSLGKLDPKNYDHNMFDIITSFEVLEHINNPIEEIKNFSKILRKKGLVYLTTPNFNSLLRYKLNENYDIITYPEHLSYYTPETLNFLFEKLNFRKLKLQTTGISLTKLKTKKGQVSVGAISKDSVDENVRIKIENIKILSIIKLSINICLSIFKKGDSIKGWYTKI